MLAISNGFDISLRDCEFFIEANNFTSKIRHATVSMPRNAWELWILISFQLIYFRYQYPECRNATFIYFHFYLNLLLSIWLKYNKYSFLYRLCLQFYCWHVSTATAHKNCLCSKANYHALTVFRWQNRLKLWIVIRRNSWHYL